MSILKDPLTTKQTVAAKKFHFSLYHNFITLGGN